LNLPNRRYARGLLLLAFSLLLVSFSLVSTAGYALSLPAKNPAEFNPAAQEPLQNANTATSSATTTTAAASTTSTTTNSTTSSVAPVTPQFANWPAWHEYMSNVPTPHAGCSVATYPNHVWQPTQCGTAPSALLQPSAGNTGDWAVQSQSSGTCPPSCIGSSTGSFPSVSGLTSEYDGGATGCSPAGLQNKGGVSTFSCGDGGANDFSLQINSQKAFITQSNYIQSAGGSIFNAQGWEQFDFTNDPNGPHGASIFISYWLINYNENGVCPGTPPPGGISWRAVGPNCFSNGPSMSVPSQTVSNLGALVFTASANYGNSGNDVVTICIGNKCYKEAMPDQVLNLYKVWNQSEFNILGVQGGSQAVFNSGTTITVENTLKDQSGKQIVPSCYGGGTTGESNNLYLGACAVKDDSIVFPESNGIQALVTGVASGSGSVSPNCPLCLEPAHVSVTVKATPSSGWQFSSWSTQTGISCILLAQGGNTNPCGQLKDLPKSFNFDMPGNDVKLEATFIPVITVSYTIHGGGTPPQYPPSTTLRMVFRKVSS